MLTLKLITEETDRVLKGLEKKHFKGASEAIAQVIDTDRKRREAQTQLDKNLAEAKKMAAEIGGLMKQGKKEEPHVTLIVPGISVADAVTLPGACGTAPPSQTVSADLIFSVTA